MPLIALNPLGVLKQGARSRMKKLILRMGEVFSVYLQLL